MGGDHQKCCWQHTDRLESEITRLREQVEMLERQRDDWITVEKRALRAEVEGWRDLMEQEGSPENLTTHLMQLKRERDEAHKIIEHEREMRMQSEINYRCTKDKLDEALAQVAVLLEEANRWIGWGDRPSGPCDCRVCRRIRNGHFATEARALLDRLQRAEAVVEALSELIAFVVYQESSEHLDRYVREGRKALAAWEEGKT